MDAESERLLAEWEGVVSENPGSAEEFFAAREEVRGDPARAERLAAKAAELDWAERACRELGRPQSHSEAQEKAVEELQSEGYKYLRFLGKGGYSEVSLMRDPHGRKVAVKVLHGGGKIDVARLTQEADVIKNLDHPNIVRLIEYRDDNERPVLVMEYVAGSDLKKKFANDRASPTQAASIARDLADALAHAHENGVIHRDIKPSNVRITDDEVVKILDFGLAKPIGSEAHYTQTGQWVGTPHYMAPEQFLGGPEADALAVDVYGIGGVLYYLLTGKPVREGTEHLTNLRQEPRFPRSLNSDVPLALEAICMKCLATKPGKRYGSARDLHLDLQRFLDNEPVEAPQVLFWQRMWAVVRRYPTTALAFVFSAVFMVLATTFLLSAVYYPGVEVVDPAEMLKDLQQTPKQKREALFNQKYRGRRIRSRGQLVNLASMASPSATNAPP